MAVRQRSTPGELRADFQMSKPARRRERWKLHIRPAQRGLELQQDKKGAQPL